MFNLLLSNYLIKKEGRTLYFLQVLSPVSFFAASVLKPSLNLKYIVQLATIVSWRRNYSWQDATKVLCCVRWRVKIDWDGMLLPPRQAGGNVMGLKEGAVSSAWCHLYCQRDLSTQVPSTSTWRLTPTAPTSARSCHDSITVLTLDSDSSNSSDTTDCLHQWEERNVSRDPRSLFTQLSTLSVWRGESEGTWAGVSIAIILRRGEEGWSRYNSCTWFLLFPVKQFPNCPLNKQSLQLTTVNGGKS